jgi:DNA-binding MarR family transcriptional regulator
MEGQDRADGLAVWRELCETVAAVRLSLNRDLRQNVGISLAENLVLCQVATAPDRRMRMVDISGRLMIAKSAVTRSVDRLEGRGLLERGRDTGDRRIVYAKLTDEGARLFALAQPAFEDALDRFFAAQLTEAELGLLQTTSANVRKAQPRPELDGEPDSP